MLNLKNEIESKTASYFKQSKYAECEKYLDSLIRSQECKDDIDAYISLLFSTLHLSDLILKNLGDFRKSEKLLGKSFGIYNQIDEEIKEFYPFLKFTFFGQAYALRYDVFYFENIWDKESFNYYDTVNSIYDIKESLQIGINNYWKTLGLCEVEEQLYNNKNNLANCLARTGRYVDAIQLLRENIALIPEKVEAYLSLSDHYYNFYKNSLIPYTDSFVLVNAELHTMALKCIEKEELRETIQKKLELDIAFFEENGLKYEESFLAKNKFEEINEFDLHSDYRKEVLSKNLSLNIHSLHCFCSSAKTDDLNIGISTGSRHNHPSLVFLDNLVNRIISEFSFSRYLLISASRSDKFPADVLYSDLSINEDCFGYKIETIRSSFRIAFSVLDKIANGILKLYNIEKQGKMLSFDSFFDNYELYLKDKTNIHLCALYSLSLDLKNSGESNRCGSLGHIKNIRNQIEHDLFRINNTDEFSEQACDISTFIDLTFDLLKLTRSAIFSFVLLIRSETFVEHIEN